MRERGLEIKYSFLTDVTNAADAIDTVMIEGTFVGDGTASANWLSSATVENVDKRCVARGTGGVFGRCCKRRRCRR